MSRLMTVFGLCMFIALAALPAFAAELYEDPATGQIFTKPGEGRVPVSLPAEKVGGLYEDESGMVYAKPGNGRTPVAVAEAAPEAPASDYSNQAFTEAVRHVVSDDESTTYPKVKVGTTFFGEYAYDLRNEKRNGDNTRGGRNQFSLNRGYINIKADLTPEIRVRVTPDITRMAATPASTNNGDFEFRLKYGYVGFHDFLGVYPSLEAKLGQFEGAWLDYEENLWTYRMQGTMLIEREGFMDSANLGISTQGKVPAGYGEWQALVDNGEGYHKDETNKYKSIQARLTITPLPDNDILKGLNITGFYTVGREKRKDNANLQRDRVIGFIGYKYQDDLFVGAEYLWTHGGDKFIAQPAKRATNYDGSGYSVMGWYRMPFLKPLRLMARFDQFDHNINVPGFSVSRYIYGASYDLGKYVTFLVNNEHTTSDKGLKGKEYTENLLKANLQWKF